MSYTQLPGDDPVAALTFFVPVDYAALLAQPEGEVVGTITATAVAADLGNATLALKGDIIAASATTTISSAGATVALGTAAVACTGTATHGAYWVLNLSAAGQTLQVPAYVDDVPLTIPLSSIANNTITFCLPPPDVPAGTPGRASLGAKLVSANPQHHGRVQRGAEVVHVARHRDALHAGNGQGQRRRERSRSSPSTGRRRS